ncbi:VOC family protein [Microbacterium dextranolyticum]|uniref:Glyoxalase n=1 Tax=Microbacterium dextranolyticum TaxID=36806 RepID=A0A9W6HJU4_9MICO|nr:VOC family protein [Microbacterium dextranolyticum]MBM7461843.1 catechol 2,3-dioxygenase-like lactoylglutathione lyase family enzyme [Microbacterium dextranolyticum]GLJ94084.1 glyoxalase [Microbacterium dextranolyticum]
MIAFTGAFSGFSVDDVDAAEAFYRDRLGLDVVRNEMGILEIALPGGGRVIAYPKPDHASAVFTVLNLTVADIDAAVDALNEAGVVTKIYDDPDDGTDARGVSRGRGPDIAWFRDPAGNVLSVIVPV